ncbi:MAG: hypothetical protein ABXS93_03655 [Sulfurimonas sp.]
MMFFLKSYFILYLFILSLKVYADSQEPHSQMLMDEAHCMRCHATSDFHPREEKVNNFKKLHHQVGVCADNNFAGWFEEEKQDVSTYLNNEYYKF